MMEASSSSLLGHADSDDCHDSNDCHDDNSTTNASSSSEFVRLIKDKDHGRKSLATDLPALKLYCTDVKTNLIEMKSMSENSGLIDSSFTPRMKNSKTALLQDHERYFTTPPPNTAPNANPQEDSEDDTSGENFKDPSASDLNGYDEGIPLIIRTPCSKTDSFDEGNALRPAGAASTEQEDMFLEVLNRIEYEVIDHLEDEVDAHAYEELVPFELKLALEEKVFGWSHLTSIILGHVTFTVVAYVLTFTLLTNSYYFWNPISQEIEGEGGVILHQEMPMWYQTLRFILSCLIALTIFRMVRRRSFIWFRAPYGSKAYQKDKKRRQLEVEETDKKTILGRIRQKRNLLLERSVQKKLNKASKLFEKARQKRLMNKQQEEKKHEKRVKIQEHDASQTGNSSPEKPYYHSLSASTGSISEFIDDEFDDDYDEASSDDMSTNNCNRTVSSGCTSFYTVPTNRMESIMHDQILFECGPIKRMPYSHGGFFGAAPFMLANPYWISILRHLMPDVYVEISRRVATAPATKLIHWAENNPVVAAYGTAHELLQMQLNHDDEFDIDSDDVDTPPNLEWDVFLDPKLVARVEKVLSEREKFSKQQQEQTISYLKDDLDMSDENASVQSQHQRHHHIMKYYDKELNQRVQILVDKMLIAHGNLTQLALEQTGHLKHYIYSRVKRTRCTLGGGIFARQWMAVYAEALRLGVSDRNVNRDPADDDDYDFTGRDDDDDINYGNLAPAQNRRKRYTSKQGYYNLPSLAALAESKCPNTSIFESVNILKAILKQKKPIGLILDVKSRHIPKRVWALVVDTLRNCGVRVEGIGSFTISDIRDIGHYCKTKPPVNEIMFFHSAGDMQIACHNGLIKQGDKVFFNAGSMLWDGGNCASGSSDSVSTLSTLTSLISSFDPNEVKQNYQIQPFARVTSRCDSAADIDNTASKIKKKTLYSYSTIESYKRRYNLSIGLYCQEFAIDESAISCIVRFVNNHPEVYDMGLSWGGINGITLKGIHPERFSNTDGFWNQRYIGNLWNYELVPPE